MSRRDTLDAARSFLKDQRWQVKTEADLEELVQASGNTQFETLLKTSYACTGSFQFFTILCLFF